MLFKQLDYALFEHAQESLTHKLYERMPSMNAKVKWQSFAMR